MSYFDDASLVMIPSGYKTSKVYSVKPLDGTGDLTFTRSNDTATRVGPNGLIEKVRTNIVLQSQDFTTTWNQNASPTITANTTVAPDGTTTADTIAATASFSGVYQSFASVANTTEYSWSVYIKNISSASNIFLGVVSNPSTATINFDATTGTIIGTGGSITGSSVTNVGNGWYRLSGTYVSTSTTTDFAIYGIGVMSFAAWGAQLETGVTTDYIATTSAAVSVGPVANVPRLDYLGSSCPRLLLEGQRTNLTTYSEDTTSWGKNESPVVTLNQGVSPDGYTNADKTVVDKASEGYFNFSTGTVTSGTTYTASVFLKYISGNTNVRFGFAGAGFGGDNNNVFNIQNGTVVGTVAGNTLSVQDYGNGWYRLIDTKAASATDVGGFIVYGNQNEETQFLIWGAQVEAGAYATSYIPTLGAAVTRGADAASKTGISSLIGQTEGTLFAEFQYFDNITGSAELAPIYVGNGVFATGIYVTVYEDILYATIWNGAVQQSIINCGSLIAGVYKIAIAYKQNDVAVYVNGVLIGTDTSATIPTCEQVFLGTAGASTTIEGYKISQALLFKTRLTNAQLAELTTL